MAPDVGAGGRGNQGPKPSANGLLCVAFFAAFSSMSVELISLKVFATLTDNPLIWQTAALAAYMVGLGLGGALSYVYRHRSAVQLLAVTQGVLGFLAVLWVPGVLLFHVFYRANWFHYDTWLREGWVRPLWVFCCYLLLSIVFLASVAGFDVPLLLRLAKSNSGDGNPSSSVRLSPGVLLATGYAGTLAAGLTPFACGTWVLDPFYRSLLAAFGFLVGALCALLWCPRRFQVWGGVGLCLFVLVTSFVTLFYPRILQWQVKNHAYNHAAWRESPLGIESLGPVAFGRGLFRFLDALPDVEVIQSPHQTLHILQDVNPWDPASSYSPSTPSKNAPLRLMLNGHLQFSALTERAYHEAFAHVPQRFMNSRFRKPCIFGGGDGLLAAQLLRYGDDIERITLVELDAAVLRLAREDPRFVALNKGALNDARVHVIVGDAYAVVRSAAASELVCDALFLDFPYPYDFDLLRLYSLEFYQALYKRFFTAPPQALFVALDAPQKGREVNPVLAATLNAAGFAGVRGFATTSPHQVGESFLLATPAADAGGRPVSAALQTRQEAFWTTDLERVYQELLPLKVQVQKGSSSPLNPRQQSVILNTIFHPVTLAQWDLTF